MAELPCLDLLDATPQILRGLTAGLTEDDLRWKPGPDRFSIGEVLVHLAAETVRSGRCDVALAGGVNLVLGPGGHVISSQASMLSPTGRCHSFSEDGDGFVRSEGAGVVLLKTLSRALADGDRVHAVIRSSVVNADGRTLGMSMPGADAQAAMLERAYAEGVLKLHGGKLSAAARHADMDNKNLWEKMIRYGLRSRAAAGEPADPTA